MQSLLFDARLLRPTPTGIGQYIASLVPELLRAAPQIHIHLLRQANVFAGYGVEAWDAPNLTQHVRSWRHMSIAQHWQVPVLARELKVGAIHYPHFDAPVWLASVPVIATIYDAKYLVRPSLFPELHPLKRAYMRLSFQATLRRAARAIAISHATRADLERIAPGCTDRVEVIHLAAEPALMPASPETLSAFRARYNLVRPYILSVGELRPHKNYPTLIRAYARSQAPATHDLVILGREHGADPGLTTLAAEIGIAEKVHLITDADHTGLRSAYTGATLFALVSLYEGFGLPILEAMAYGVPVIASSTTATGEILGEGGVPVLPTDEQAIATAINRLLTDALFYQQVQQQGADWHRRFSWRNAAIKTAALYNSLL